ncbi:MAG: hypothetical protein ACFFAU_04970 [Candidatus Hodarchaeota archaeon]
MVIKDNQQSIHDFLELPHRAWLLEFEINDFGASLSSILELPQKIYKKDNKRIFWSFIKEFLSQCSISFILRKYTSPKNIHDNIELALIGYWEKIQMAIPLWILNDLLLGFEIISTEEYCILDSEPLKWDFLGQYKQYRISSQNSQSTFVFSDDELFKDNKMFFKISDSKISISEYFNELEFFERIAQTIIPELDEFHEE